MIYGKICSEGVRNLIKILSSRIILIMSVAAVSACAGTGPSKRATEDEGPFSVRARNELAVNNPAGLLRIGEGFERSGNLESALNIYGQAMAADQKLVAAQIAFARVSILLGAEDRGLSMLTRLIAEYPDIDEVRGALTVAYIRRGDIDAASLFLTPILDKATTTAGHLNLGGKIAEVAGDHDRARALYEKALSKSPGDPEILQNMALSFALAEDYSTAVALLQSVMDKPSGLIAGKIALATVYALSGQLEAAMLLARGSMELDKANARLVFYQLLPRLKGDERAMAVLFDKVPRDAVERLSGGASN